MKVALLFAYTVIVLTTRRASCAAVQAPLGVISMDDITETDRRTLEFLNSLSDHNPRPKRSGQDALSALKASIGYGIKNKLGQLAKGSASASSHFSSSSSGGHYHHDVQPDFDHHKSFDFWSLKKSILNTLLQAVKAIKGGVIAIKGQLIKGSGYLISAKGKLISNKGEAITNLGKSIATSAVLSPTNGHGEEISHGHYHHGVPDEFGSPSAPGPEYEVPDHNFHHHPGHHEDSPDLDHAGILILKKIPVHDHHSEHLPVEHKVPDFKPIDHTGPTFGEIIGRFFSASTSLKPGEPAPFGDDHHHIVHHHEDDHHHHTAYHSDIDHHQSSHDLPSPDDSHHEFSPPSKEPEGPFEAAPDFLNLPEYASESKGSHQTAPPPAEPKPEAQKLQGPIKFDEVRPLSSFSNVGFDPQSNFPAVDFGAFPNPGFDAGVKYLTAPNVGPQVFPHPDYPVSVKHHAYIDNLQSSALKRPTRSKHYTHKRPVYPSRTFMKALVGDFGPSRPKRS